MGIGRSRLPPSRPVLEWVMDWLEILKGLAVIIATPVTILAQWSTWRKNRGESARQAGNASTPDAASTHNATAVEIKPAVHNSMAAKFNRVLISAMLLNRILILLWLLATAWCAVITPGSASAHDVWFAALAIVLFLSPVDSR